MLTIEELRNLSIGEWVWIVVLKEDRINKAHHGKYYQIHQMLEELADKELWCGWQGYSTAFEYKDYGTKWLAYRNKEEAEGKSITLPYLLCTSSKFACVIWRDTEGKVHKTYTMPIDEAKGVLKEKERICHTNE